MNSKTIHQITKILTDKGYEFLRSGSTRDVYLSPSKKFVVKVPRVFRGQLSDRSKVANDVEYQQYLEGKVPIAKCKLVKFLGISLIFMEFVQDANKWVERKDRPDEWRRYDGGQCGINRKGQLVIFDMGDRPYY